MNKEVIDEACAKLVNNRAKTQLTSIELIKMMRTDETCTEYQKFYASTLEAILNEENVSYEEKEQFLILHTSLIEVYKEINNK